MRVLIHRHELVLGGSQISAIDLVADIARHAFTNMQSVLDGNPLPSSDVIVAAGDNR